MKWKERLPFLIIHQILLHFDLVQLIHPKKLEYWNQNEFNQKPEEKIRNNPLKQTKFLPTHLETKNWSTSTSYNSQKQPGIHSPPLPRPFPSPLPVLSPFPFPFPSPFPFLYPPPPSPFVVLLLDLSFLG